MGPLDIVISSCVWRIPKGAISPVDAALINGTDNFSYGNSPVFTLNCIINSPNMEAPLQEAQRQRAHAWHVVPCVIIVACHPAPSAVLWPPSICYSVCIISYRGIPLRIYRFQCN